MIPYMTRHNASCIITKVSVILDYDAGIFFFIFLDFAVCLTSLSLLLTSFCRDYVRGGPEGALASLPPRINTQSCIEGLLMVQDFCFWAV